MSNTFVGGKLDAGLGGVWMREDPCGGWTFLEETWAENDSEEWTEPQYVDSPGNFGGQFKRELVAPGQQQGGTFDLIFYAHSWHLAEEILKQQQCGVDVMIAYVCAQNDDKRNQASLISRRILTGVATTGADRSAMVTRAPDDERPVQRTFNLRYAADADLLRLNRTTDATLTQSLNKMWPLDEPSCGSVICNKPRRKGYEEFIIVGDAGASATLRKKNRDGTYTDLQPNLSVALQTVDLTAVGHGDTIVVGARDVAGGFDVSKDGGDDFARVTSATDLNGSPVTIGAIADLYYMDGLFVAVQANGRFLKSVNGLSWRDMTPSPAPAAGLNAVAMASNSWGVAVGDTTTVLVFRQAMNQVESVGAALKIANGDLDVNLTCVAVDNDTGMILVGGASGFFALSPDQGDSWTVANPGTSDPISGIAMAGCDRVLITTAPGAGTGKILESYQPQEPDFWSEITDSGYAGTAALNGVTTCHANKFVAWSADGYPVFLEFARPS